MISVDSGVRWAPAAVAGAAVLAFPFYLGLRHASFSSLISYSLFASFLLALGTWLETRKMESAGPWTLPISLATWALLTGLIGSVSYGLALIF